MISYKGISESDIDKLDDLLWGRLLLSENANELDKLVKEYKSQGIWYVISFLTNMDDPYRTTFSEILEVIYA